MEKQSLISKIVCMLGGDRYTLESTQQALKEAHDKAKRQPEILDIHKGRYIFFSEYSLCHLWSF